jgi:hypothetical protein
MSRRSDSNIDLDKYQPSVEDLRRAADEEAAQARLRKALDNPALDAALLELRGQPVAPGAASGTPPTDPPGPEDTSGPQAKAAPAAPPVTSRIKTAARGSGPRGVSVRSKVAATIALAFLPAMVVYVLFVRPQPRDPTGPASSASATVTPLASAPPSVTVRAPATPAPVPSASQSAEPQPTVLPSAVPTVAPRSPSPRPPSTSSPVSPKRRAAGDDPYGEVPTPPQPKSAEPAPPPASASVAPPPPPPTKPKIIN